jgi:flagellar biosynthetic protein FliO
MNRILRRCLWCLSSTPLRLWTGAALLLLVIPPTILSGVESGIIDYGTADTGPDTATATTAGSPVDHLIQLVLGLLLIMGLIAACAVALRAWQRGGLRKMAGRRHMEVVESLIVGPKRSVVLVRVGGRALVLGCGEEVRLLESMPAEALERRAADADLAAGDPTLGGAPAPAVSGDDSGTGDQPAADHDPSRRLSAFKQRLHQRMEEGRP